MVSWIKPGLAKLAKGWTQGQPPSISKGTTTWAVVIALMVYVTKLKGSLHLKPLGNLWLSWVLCLQEAQEEAANAFTVKESWGALIGLPVALPFGQIFVVGGSIHSGLICE